MAYHSSLTEDQANKLERCQAVALRIILQDEYLSYESALITAGLEKLSLRRQARCLDFSLKCIGHPENKRFFPRNPNIGSTTEIREREQFIVNFARTRQYKESAIPFCQRLLNSYCREKGAVPGDGRAGAGAETGTRGRGRSRRAGAGG